MLANWIHDAATRSGFHTVGPGKTRHQYKAIADIASTAIMKATGRIHQEGRSGLADRGHHFFFGADAVDVLIGVTVLGIAQSGSVEDLHQA
jgi:hypothetical protein